MTNQSENENDDLKKKLHSRLQLLPSLFAMLDSPEEHEASSALRQIKKTLSRINTIQETLTGENPEFTFAKLYALIDANAGVDVAQFEALLTENEALRKANQQFAVAEEGYKQTIQTQEEQIKNLQKKQFSDETFNNSHFNHHIPVNPLSAFTQNVNSIVGPSRRPSGPSPS